MPKAQLSTGIDLYYEEFGTGSPVVLMPGTPLAGAQVFAERVRSKIAERLSVTISGGVASADKVQDGKALIKNADLGLYAAKESGRNRVVPWSDELLQKLRRTAASARQKKQPPEE